MISLLLVVSFILSTIPFGNFAHVFAQEQNQPQTSEQSKNQKDKRIELKHLRSETSKTYLNPNGTYTTEISEKPIHYWKKILKSGSLSTIH